MKQNNQDGETRSLIVSIFINVFIISMEIIAGLIGKQEKNIHLIRNIRNHILKNENIVKVENISLMKFGQSYLVILSIYFKDNINLKDADLERNRLEEDIKLRYSTVNKIILKMHYKGGENNAGITRSGDSKKSFAKKVKE